MKRLVAKVALALVLLAGTFARAEESPLELVRALRERQMADLARDYLEKSLPKAPPDLVPKLVLELARTRMDVAAGEPNIDKRLAGYRDSRAGFQEFLAKYPNDSAASAARLDLARVSVAQGKTQLAVALRQDSAAAKYSEALKARALLEDAGKQLKPSAGQLKKEWELRKNEEPKTPKEVQAKRDAETDMLRAQFEIGLNFYDQALTYVDEATKDESRVARSRTAQKAVEAVKAIANGNEKLPITWEAKAWLGRCEFEAGVPAKDIRRRYMNIINDKEPAAAIGQRLARYFLILIVPEAPDVAAKEDPNKTIQTVAEEWLRRYPSYKNTPEGYGVRYELAESLLKQAVNIKQPVQQKALFDLALKYFKELEQSENEYADLARSRKINIIFTRQGGDKEKLADVSKLNTFDDCYVRAQYEFFQMSQADDKKKTPEEIEAARKAHLATITTALTRAIDLAKQKAGSATASDLNAVRAMLAFTYLSTSKYAEAVKVGEELARQRPPTGQGAKGAIYALQGYTQLDEERDAMKDLAEYVEKTWPDEYAGHMARHQLGLYYIKEKNLPAAIAKLKGIKRDYDRFIMSQFVLALAYQQAQNDKLPVGPNDKPWAQLFQETLESINELPPAADALLTQTYVQARVRLASLYYEMKRQSDVEAIVNNLEAKFPALPDDVKSSIETLKVLLVYARADKLFKAGKYKEACTEINPVIDRLKAGELVAIKKNEKLKVPILGLALRANVQNAQPAKAQDILKILQDSDKGEELGSDPTQLLFSLASQLKEQVAELRKQGDKAKDQLDKTVNSFMLFLDELAKQEKLPVENRLFLAQSYSGLDKHDKAAALLEKLEEPAAGADAKQVGYYRGGRMMYVRELRLNKEYAKAAETIKQIEGQPWGKNAQVKKEKILVDEDQEKYVPAAKEWDALMAAIKPRVATDPNTKELYWEAYYHLVCCVYKDGFRQTDTKIRQARFKQAARYINQLEKSQKDWGGDASRQRFAELLESEKPLRDAYDQLKGAGQETASKK
jgi:hypothetical protein